MDITEALMQLRVVLSEKYGSDDPVIKVALDHKTYEGVIHDMIARERYLVRYSDIGGELSIYGIQIVPRERDKF